MLRRAGGEAVGDPARPHRDEAGLAEADEHADDEKLREILRQAAARRGQAPDDHADKHEVLARQAIAEIAEDRRGQEVAEHEGRSGPQPAAPSPRPRSRCIGVSTAAMT